VAVITFPILFTVMLFVTGYAQIEFGSKKGDKAQTTSIAKRKNSRYLDSLAIANSKTYMALQQERRDLEKERELLLEQQQRIDMLQRELDEQRKEIAKERKKFENVVNQNDELEQKRIRQLAKMYEAMRPAEAARILETLDDDLCMKILQNINDARQKGRILSSLSDSKASRISKKMGNSKPSR